MHTRNNAESKERLARAEERNGKGIGVEKGREGKNDAFLDYGGGSSFVRGTREDSRFLGVGGGEGDGFEENA